MRVRVRVRVRLRVRVREAMMGVEGGSEGEAGDKGEAEKVTGWGHR